MSNTPHTRDFNRYPMLLLAIYFACGIVIARMQSIEPFGAIAVAAAFVATSLVKRGSAAFVLPLIFVPLGIVCYEIESRSVADHRVRRTYDERRIGSGEPVEIDGTLLGFPEPAYGGWFLKLRVSNLSFNSRDIPASGTVRLFLPLGDGSVEDVTGLDLRHGSRLRIACRLEREEQYLNPGVASAVEMLDLRGIDAVGVIKSPLLIEKLGDDPVFLPMQWTYQARRHLIQKFRDTFSAETSGVLIASLLGEDSFLDRGTAETFREGGTFHVLVISGLHITFIGGLALWMTAFFTRRMLVRSIFASGFLWAYTFAVGAETPVVRASLMFSFLLVARLLYRKSSLVNALGACTILILVWRPSDLVSPSFQLTFVSVAAIVGCSFPLIEKLRAIGRWYPSADEPFPPNVRPWIKRLAELLYWNEDAWKIENRRQIWSANLFKAPYLDWIKAPNLKFVVSYIFEGLLVSLIVQIWMLPLLVIYFHRLSPAGLVLNLWVGLFLAVESFAAIGAVMIGSFSDWLAAPIVALAEIANAAMMLLPSLFSSLDAAGFRVPVYSGPLSALYPLYCVVLAIVAVQLFRWEPFVLTRPRSGVRIVTTASGLTAILGTAIIFHPFSAPSATGLLTVEFLDVGQGDSALVSFPDGQTMLIDGGGRPDFRKEDERDFEPDTSRIGERVVSEFLWEKGYSRLDYIVATHADADHMQGLTDVVRNFDVGRIFIGAEPTTDPDFDEFNGLARRYEIPVEKLRQGRHVRIGGVDVRVLNPRDTDHASSNNASVVLQLTFGSRSFLLTGDIERDAEADLVNDAGVDLRTDVVKVPHHGSKTSSTQGFVDRVGAGLAIVPVGRRSRFGHPHASVVDRWTNAGAQVLTTGARGTISVETDGEILRVRTFVP